MVDFLKTVLQGESRWLLILKVLAGISMLAALFIPEGEAGTLYITNRGSGDLTIFQEASFQIDQVIPIGPQPWGVAVTPDRKAGCVSYSNGLAILDLTKKRVERHIPLNGQGMGVAISPDSSWCYVAVNSSGGDRVFAVDRRKGTIEREVSIGARAFGVYISPDGNMLYVPEHAGFALSVIETRFLTLHRRIPLDPFGRRGFARPHYLAMSPDGRTLYLPFVGLALVAIDTATLTKSTHPLTINAHQHGIAISPDGTKLYLANNVLGGAGSLSEIDVATLEELRRFPMDRHHEQVMVDSEGRHVYLSGGFVMGHRAHDKLTVVNLKNGAIIHLETGGELPFGIFRAP